MQAIRLYLERGLSLFLRGCENVLHGGIRRRRKLCSSADVLAGAAHRGEAFVADFLDHCAGFLCERHYLAEGSAFLYVNRVDLPAGVEGFSDGVFAVDQTCFLIIHSNSFIYNYSVGSMCALIYNLHYTI